MFHKRFYLAFKYEWGQKVGVIFKIGDFEEFLSKLENGWD